MPPSVVSDRTEHCYQGASRLVHTAEVALGWRLQSLHCDLSVYIKTSQVIVVAPRNLKLAPLLAVAALSARNLFI